MEVEMMNLDISKTFYMPNSHRFSILQLWPICPPFVEAPICPIRSSSLGWWRVKGSFHLIKLGQMRVELKPNPNDLWIALVETWKLKQPPTWWGIHPHQTPTSCRNFVPRLNVCSNFKKNYRIYIYNQQIPITVKLNYQPILCKKCFKDN